MVSFKTINSSLKIIKILSNLVIRLINKHLATNQTLWEAIIKISFSKTTKPFSNLVQIHSNLILANSMPSNQAFNQVHSNQIFKAIIKMCNFNR
jgi:hypothetical protein